MRFRSEYEEMEFQKFKGAGVYADLMLDHTFKKAFDPDSENKVCLVAMLNALLEGEIDAPIRDVRSRDKERRGDSRENRSTVFDLYCVDDRGRRFIIEMQISVQDNIVERAVYYASQAVVSQGERGRGYDYSLSPVFTVVFTEFEVFGDTRCVRNAKLRESGGGALSGTLNFTFVELPKFGKSLSELEGPLDKCLYALKHIKELREMPPSYTGSGFERLFLAAKLAKLTKEELAMIDLEQKRKWDAYAVRKHNRNVRSKAIAEGRAEGLAQGLAEGRAQGQIQKACEMARGFRDAGVPLHVIANVSGLSEEEIQKL